MFIHPLSLVSTEAELDRDVSVGPFAIIEAGAILGQGCRIEAGAQIRGGSTLGPRCLVGPGTVIGGDPQVRGFDSRIPSRVVVGADNTFRENVTVHRSFRESGETRLGNGNFLMAGSHVGHDCVVGDDSTLANGAMLGGHVQLGDRCFLGGGCAVHQFVRIGDLVVTQGLSGFSLDVPPYLMGAGINQIVGINAVGLKRAGFSHEKRIGIKEAFRRVFRTPQTLKEILASVRESETDPDVFRFYKFLSQDSKKGLCIRGRKAGKLVNES